MIVAVDHILTVHAADRDGGHTGNAAPKRLPLTALDRMQRHMLISALWLFAAPLDTAALCAAFRASVARFPSLAAHIDLRDSELVLAPPAGPGARLVCASCDDPNVVRELLPEGCESIADAKRADAQFARPVVNGSVDAIFHALPPAMPLPDADPAADRSDVHDPLLSAVYLTFPADAGAASSAIAIRINHAVADASTFYSFVEDWANRSVLFSTAAAGTAPAPAPPVPCIVDNLSAMRAFAAHLPPDAAARHSVALQFAADADPAGPPPPYGARRYRFRPAGLARLKRDVHAAIFADADAAGRTSSSPPLPHLMPSTDDCLTAYVWRTLAALPSRDPDTPSALHRPANMRLALALPPDTPGNLPINTVFNALLPARTPLHELALALRRRLRDFPFARVLRFVLDRATTDDLWFCSRLARPNQPDLVVSSWRAFPLHSPAFAAAAADGPTKTPLRAAWFSAESFVGFPNIAQLLAAPSDDGEDGDTSDDNGGGVVLQLCLVQEEMELLERAFLSRPEYIS
ncbi:hypothetical protein HK405_011823 [Cladochytrium tenue]|nr:hypothetical protein HK405_011823 [Cladochytrium tenue]